MDVQLAMSKNERWPKLDFTSSIKLNELDSKYTPALGGMDSPDVTAGFNFSLPLENRLARANVRKSAAEKMKALYAFKNLKNEISNRLQRLKDNERLQRNVVKFASTASNTQMQKLKEQMLKYHSGRSSSYEIVQYQDDAIMAKLASIDAWTKYYDIILALKLEAGNIVLSPQSNGDDE